MWKDKAILERLSFIPSGGEVSRNNSVQIIEKNRPWDVSMKKKLLEEWVGCSPPDTSFRIFNIIFLREEFFSCANQQYLKNVEWKL